MKLFYFLGLALCTPRSIIDEISHQRAIRGITPITKSEALDNFLLEYLLAGSNETRLDIPDKDSCDAFLNLTSCRTLPAKEFALKEGISVFAIPKESNIYREIDDILTSEVFKDIIFNRQHYACTPFKTAASVEQGDNIYIMLSPFGNDDVNGYRPVDFPSPSCKLKGMEAYTVPTAYSPEVHELYHRLNVDLTMRNMKPFMFSSLLTLYTGTDLATKLLCSSFADAACLSDTESILSPSIMPLPFQRSPDTLAQLLESPEYQGLVDGPPEDSWRYWQAVGIQTNQTHISFNFATNYPFMPELMNGVCKEPCMRHRLK